MTDLSVIVCVAFDHRADPEGLRSFKRCIAECDRVEEIMECSGTFNLIVQARFDSFADYTARLDRIADQVRLNVTRIETNFVSKRVDRSGQSDDSHRLWVPCEGGKKAIEVCKIDKIIADGDYMHIHVGDWHCLVHDTMRHLHDSLGDRFILLHRSALVRVDFIERALHINRRWTVRLCDGTNQRVAKSHVADVIHLISAQSSINGAIKSKDGLSFDDPAPLNELRMHTA